MGMERWKNRPPAAALPPAIQLRRHEIHGLQIEGAARVVRPLWPQPIEIPDGLEWRPNRSRPRVKDGVEMWFPSYKIRDDGMRPVLFEALAKQCPLGQPGEYRLVKEAFAVYFAADHAEDAPPSPGPAWIAAAKMPPQACRYVVKVESLSLDRLDDKLCWVVDLSMHGDVKKARV